MQEYKWIVLEQGLVVPNPRKHYEMTKILKAPESDPFDDYLLYLQIEQEFDKINYMRNGFSVVLLLTMGLLSSLIFCAIVLGRLFK